MLNGFHDVLVARAAAQISSDTEANFFFSRIWILFEQAVGPDDHAGGAEAALEAMHLAEAFLQGSHCSIGIGHAFNGCHNRTLGLYGEHGAGFDRLAIEVNSAGTAMGRFTADMGSREGKVLAQEMHQQGAGFAQAIHVLAIDFKFDVNFCHEFSP
jgi:hypothetical protein